MDMKEAREEMERLKANTAKLNACNDHLFELADKSREMGLGLYQCVHCKGLITGLELHWYMVGRAHGGANQ